MSVLMWQWCSVSLFTVTSDIIPMIILYHFIWVLWYHATTSRPWKHTYQSMISKPWNHKSPNQDIICTWYHRTMISIIWVFIQSFYHTWYHGSRWTVVVRSCFKNACKFSSYIVRAVTPQLTQFQLEGSCYQASVRAAEHAWRLELQAQLYIRIPRYSA